MQCYLGISIVYSGGKPWPKINLEKKGFRKEANYTSARLKNKT